MTQRTIVVTGFAVLFVIILRALILVRRNRSRVAPVWEVIDFLTRRRVAEVIAVLIWAWLGWHFLAR
jgi:hypothetical protein